MLSHIEENIKRGQLDRAVQQINLLPQSQYVQGLILRSQVFERKRDFQEAHKYANKALELSLSQGDINGEIAARVALAYALLRLKDYNQSMMQIRRTELILTNHAPPDLKNRNRYTATLKNIEGIINRLQGNLSMALKLYEESLEIRKTLNNRQEIAFSLTNIGTVHQIRGNLKEALEFHMEALEMFVELGDDQHIAGMLHDIAGIYWERGNFELAKDYFEKALNIRLALKYPLDIVKTLYELIHLEIESDYLDQAQFYFDMLEEIVHAHQALQIYQILAQASLLKTSSRLIKRANAQKLYYQALEINPIDVLLKKDALLNLCDLLLIDLKISKNEEILQEVEKLSSDLLDLAKKEQSNSLLVETLMLQSKLALVNLNLELAQNLLNQAEIVANQSELSRAAFRVSMEHDLIMDKLSKWDSLKKRNASLIERVEEVNIHETIDQLLSRRHQEVIERKVEQPLFLVILNQDAITLYSRKFSDEITINEQLLGGFLMATDFTITEALDNHGSIERIKYGDYNLIFLKHDLLTFCYAFSGQSYYAIQRLSGFIDRIKLGVSWHLLTERVPKPKRIHDELDEKADQFFLSQEVMSNPLK